MIYCLSMLGFDPISDPKLNLKLDPLNEVEYSIENVLTCRSCDNKSSRIEKNIILSLALPEKSETELTLDSLLQTYFKSEIVEYHCAKCNETEAIMQHNSKTSPSTLILHLVRFNTYINELEKRNDHILIPLDILSHSYRLTGIIAHLGRSISAGHYIYHKRQKDDLFTTYNDSLVTKNCTISLNSRTAYLLIYDRVV